MRIIDSESSFSLLSVRDGAPCSGSADGRRRKFRRSRADVDVLGLSQIRDVRHFSIRLPAVRDPATKASLRMARQVPREHTYEARWITNAHDASLRLARRRDGEVRAHAVHGTSVRSEHHGSVSVVLRPCATRDIRPRLPGLHWWKKRKDRNRSTKAPISMR